MAADDISGYCQINVDELRREDFYTLFFFPPSVVAVVICFDRGT